MHCIRSVHLCNVITSTDAIHIYIISTYTHVQYTCIHIPLKELGVLVAIIIRDEGLLSFNNMN